MKKVRVVTTPTTNDEVIKDWNFNTGLEEWLPGSTHEVASYSWNSQGFIEGSVTGYDPQIAAFDLNLPVTSNTVVKIRMKVNSATYFGHSSSRPSLLFQGLWRKNEIISSFPFQKNLSGKAANIGSCLRQALPN